MKATLNGVTYTGTPEELATLAKLLSTATTVAVEETAKDDAPAIHQNVAKAAVAAMKRAGFECSTYQRGSWLWLKDSNGANRSEEFRAVRLANGWQFSPKRGQFYRVFE